MPNEDFINLFHNSIIIHKMSGKRMSVLNIFAIFTIVVANIYSFPIKYTIGIDVFLLLVTCSICRGVRGDSEIKSILKLLVFLLFYTLVVCIVNMSFSSYSIGKPLRLLFACLFFFAISKKIYLYSQKEFEYGIIGGLGIHLASIYIQFFKPETKMLFYSFLDTEKEDITNYALRSFGLCSSFDAAGLYLCVLIVLLWIIFKREKKFIYLFFSFITLVGCFLVSRTSMIVSSVFFILLLFSLMKNNRKHFFIATTLVVIGVFYTWNYAGVILQAIDIEQSYRPESQQYLTGEMIFLPSSIVETIIGTGENAHNSDIGYVKIIYMIGLFGLCTVLLLYWKTIKQIRYCKKIIPDMYQFMVLFLLLLFLFNYKLLLLYSRGINDLYFLLIFVLLRKQQMYAYENNKTCNI